MPAFHKPASSSDTLTVVEDRPISEFWADGAVLEDDGEVIRFAFFSTQRHGAASPVSRMAVRIVMPPRGFAWSLQGALALPTARGLIMPTACDLN